MTHAPRPNAGRTRLAAFVAVATFATVVAMPAASARVSDAQASTKATNRVAAAGTKVSNLVDHGGKILPSSNTYAVYWGPTASFPSDLKAGMAALLSGFSGSSYLNTATQYMRGAKATTTYGGDLADTSAPPNKAPSTSALTAEVAKVLSAAGKAPEPNAVYLVYTSNLPNIRYCAWHDWGTINNVVVQIAYLPNMAGTTSCFPTTDKFGAINSWSYGTKANADNTAHEFMEAITDATPSSSAWIDGSAEIGDKCNFVYNSVVTLSGNNNQWQIQAEWSNAISGCAQTT